jgi:putative DNA primase/helicase
MSQSNVSAAEIPWGGTATATDLAQPGTEETVRPGHVAKSTAQPASRLVAAPTHPMAVARGLVNEVYLRPEGVVLRDHRGHFYHWDGRCWPEVEQRDVRGTAYQWLEDAAYVHPEKGELPFAPSRRKIDDVVDALRAVVRLESKHEAPTWTDGRTDLKPSEIVSMSNGLLHVPTRTLSPHTPTFFVHHSLPFAYVPMAPAPSQWLDFLHQLWADDASSISALQEVMGYVLGGDTRLQKIFLFVGPKRGGKGTIARVLSGLLGPHHVACPTLASLSTNFGLAPLIGKPLAVISDARLSTRADSKVVVERLLSISGEDSLTIDRKFREPWTGRLPTRFCIFSNELPKLSDASGALASRFILFVLTKSFYGRENPRLTDELLTEAPSIFNWALQGLDRLTERGYFVNPESGSDAIQQLEDLSSPISAFVRDVCVIGRYQVDADQLWTGWKTWCESDNRHPGTKAVFGRDLKAAVPSLKRSRPRTGDTRDYAYEGIGLRSEEHIARSLGPLGPDAPAGPSGPSSSAMHHQQKLGSDNGDVLL